MGFLSARVRRKLLSYALIGLLMIGVVTLYNWQHSTSAPRLSELSGSAAEALRQLEVKGRAPKTGYDRSKFGDGWSGGNDCDTREQILRRDLTEVVLSGSGCKVDRGVLHDPYSGQSLQFIRGPETSDDIQIDHVVALSDAWQKGAQALDYERRVQFANDPLELLAVDGELNQEKGAGDAATWLPPNKSFRCAYVARQIVVKTKYELWITAAERDAMARILETCPGQKLPN